MGLNDNYSVIRNNILMSSHLSYVMQAFNIVSQEESQRSLSSTNNKYVFAFVVKKPFKYNAKNLNLKCSHCGGLRHLVVRCYQLIGFPDKGAGEKNMFNKTKSGNHFVGNKSMINSTSCNSSNNTENISLTSEMHDQLVKLFNSQRNEKKM